MILVVGLGNYGKEYDGTKHNAGFMLLDYVAKESGVIISKKTCKSLVGQGIVNGKSVIFAKPLTYMNLSGQAVVQLTNVYKPEKTIIVYDDIDLPFGEIRFREKGSAGTHNGMRNIVQLMGTENLPRLRLGIKPQEEIYSLADYVLAPIGKEYKDLFLDSIYSASEKLKEFIGKND